MQNNIGTISRSRSKTLTSQEFNIPLLALNSSEQWYDVQDENGDWRVGFCQKNYQNYKKISLDGFHPSHTAFYCHHSDKLATIRTHTKGLTVPIKKTLRKVITMTQLKQMKGNVTLVLQLQSDLFMNSAQRLLIFIDKIFNTPFQIYKAMNYQNPMDKVDITITNLFLNVIECYFTLLQNSKKILTLRQTQKADSPYKDKAQQLYLAIYQMSQMMSMILGFHPRSKAFYESPLNITVTRTGNVDYFIKSETGLLSLKLFFKYSSIIKAVGVNDLTIYLQVVYLFLDICEAYQKETLQGKTKATIQLTIQEIVKMLKGFIQKNVAIGAQLRKKDQLVSRIQALYFKAFPNKPCGLRQLLVGQIKVKQKRHPVQSKPKPMPSNQKDQQRILQLQTKLASLQQIVNKIQTTPLYSSPPPLPAQNQPVQPTCNLGEQAFLGSLQWALQAGDVQSCRKLVAWRRGLLKLGRITGWQIALAVGMRTFKKKVIEHDDIIQANYEYMQKYIKQ